MNVALHLALTTLFLMFHFCAGDSRDFKPEDLQNRYRDWQNKHDLHYLSVLNKTGLKRSASQTVDLIDIIVGEDEPQFGDYKNGPLAPTRTYRYWFDEVS